MGFVTYHALMASRGDKMKVLPFEDFIPHWDAGLKEETEEQTEEQRAALRAKMLETFKAAAGGVDLRRGSQLRPKRER